MPTDTPTPVQSTDATYDRDDAREALALQLEHAVLLLSAIETILPALPAGEIRTKVFTASMRARVVVEDLTAALKACVFGEGSAVECVALGATKFGTCVCGAVRGSADCHLAPSSVASVKP